jgi:hypothetical protein
MMEEPLEHVRNELKHAAPIALGNVLFLLLCLILVALYFVFEIFMRPLLWAVLIGSFLYPLKRSLVLSINEWLEHICQHSRAPMLWALFVVVSKIPERMLFWLFGKPERVITLVLTCVTRSGIVTLDQVMSICLSVYNAVVMVRKRAQREGESVCVRACVCMRLPLSTMLECYLDDTEYSCYCRFVFG